MKYLALVIEVLPDEEGANGHAELLVGPLDAAGPAHPLAQDAQQDLTELYALLLVVVYHVRHYRHH